MIKFGQFMQYGKRKILIKKFCEKCGLEIHDNKKMWLYMSHISRLLQNIHFPIEAVLNSLQTQNWN